MTDSKKSNNLIKPIVLIGLSGAGKTTVGKKLAVKLKLKFYDSDQIIEKQNNSTIAEIFAKRGEKSFRRIERSVIEKLISGNKKKSVIALGGGSIENKETRKLVLGSSIVIYLSCSIEQIYQRLKNKTNRPLMLGKNQEQLSKSELIQKIKLLHAKRKSNYLKANLKISSSEKTETEIVKQIITKLKDLK